MSGRYSVPFPPMAYGGKSADDGLFFFLVKQKRRSNAPITRAEQTPATVPTMMPICALFNFFDVPEAEPDGEPPADVLFKVPLTEDPLMSTMVARFEKLMPGILVDVLEAYTYAVVPEGGVVGSAHWTVTELTKAWNWPPAAV